MVVTHQKKIPWWWVFMMALPPLGNAFVEHCSGNPLTFIMRRQIDIPALITFLGSINIAFNAFVAPFIAFQSDRIWTRFGRRKPFIIAGWIGLIASLVLVPLAPNIWLLALAIVAYQFFEDIAFTGPWGPLYFEVVPLQQRGRGTAINALMGTLVGLYFNYFLIGHFDDVYELQINLTWLGNPIVSFGGHHFIFWQAALIIFVMIFHVFFNIKETPVHSPVLGERFSIMTFLRSTFGQRQWRLIYLLIFSQIAMNQGLVQMGALMMTEQFGYTKKELGEIGVWTLLLKIAIVIPVAGYLADKVDRVKMFQCGLALSTLHQFGYWLFIKCVAANQIPSKEAIVVINTIGTFVDVAGNIALGPLFFDFVPRDRMGTVSAGMTFVRGLVKLTVNSGVGVWVTAYSWMLLPEAPDGKAIYDYSSGLLYTTLIGVGGIAVSFYFASQRRQGKIIEYGRIELQSDEPRIE